VLNVGRKSWAGHCGTAFRDGVNGRGEEVVAA